MKDRIVICSECVWRMSSVDVPSCSLPFCIYGKIEKPGKKPEVKKNG